MFVFCQTLTNFLCTKNYISRSKSSEHTFAYVRVKNRINNCCRRNQRLSLISKRNNRIENRALRETHLSVCVLRTISGRGNDL